MKKWRNHESTDLRRYGNEKTNAYSYEVTEIELLEGTHGDDINGELPRSNNNSIPAAKLLKEIVTAKGNEEKVSKIIHFLFCRWEGRRSGKMLKT